MILNECEGVTERERDDKAMIGKELGWSEGWQRGVEEKCEGVKE